MRNRYELDTQEERDREEAEWELWQEMSDEEITRELESVMREYEETLSLLTPEKRYRAKRRDMLSNCITARSVKNQFPEIGGNFLRSAQWRLWGLRYERRTGVVPGSA